MSSIYDTCDTCGRSESALLCTAAEMGSIASGNKAGKRVDSRRDTLLIDD